jgi:hypothetical protein
MLSSKKSCFLVGKTIETDGMVFNMASFRLARFLVRRRRLDSIDRETKITTSSIVHFKTRLGEKIENCVAMQA